MMIMQRYLDDTNTVQSKVPTSVIYRFFDKKYTKCDYIALTKSPLSEHDDRFVASEYNHLAGSGLVDLLIHICVAHGNMFSRYPKVVIECQHGPLVGFYRRCYFEVIYDGKTKKYTSKYQAIPESIRKDMGIETVPPSGVIMMLTDPVP